MIKPIQNPSLAPLGRPPPPHPAVPAPPALRGVAIIVSVFR
jgi:hypothetical protein